MKKILLTLTAIAALVFTGCDKNSEPYATAGEDDYPRILNTDIEETTGGKPSSLPTISRDANFEFEVIVTPVKYTTVSWYFDGEKVFEGNKIDMPFLAGDYEVKIVATTTKGKETHRNCTLKVLPLPTDPVLGDGAKERWLQFGTTVSVSGSNLDGIYKAYLKGPSGNESHRLLELGNLTVASDNISFDVPELSQEGDYRMILENVKGEQFGCGIFGLHSDEYIEPGMVEKVLWEGDNALNWDGENIKVTAEALADVPAGAELMIYYTKIDESELAEKYWALRIVDATWDDRKDILPQTDFGPIEDMPYILEYTAERKAIVEDGGSMSLVGNGLKIQKITYMSGSVPAENLVWEGSVDINWGDSNVQLTPDMMEVVPAGAIIVLGYQMIEAEYHALRITNIDWGTDIVAQVDGIQDSYPESYEFEYTADVKSIVDGGAMVNRLRLQAYESLV